MTHFRDNEDWTLLQSKVGADIKALMANHGDAGWGQSSDGAHWASWAASGARSREFPLSFPAGQ